MADNLKVLLTKRAKEHLSKIRGELLELYIPEYDLTVWHKTTMMAKELQAVLALQSENKLLEAAAMKLIYMLRFEDGTKMYNPGEKDELLRNWHYDVITSVCNKIDKVTENNGEEEPEKNSEPAQT